GQLRIQGRGNGRGVPEQQTPNVRLLTLTRRIGDRPLRPWFKTNATPAGRPAKAAASGRTPIEAARSALEVDPDFNLPVKPRRADRRRRKKAAGTGPAARDAGIGERGRGRSSAERRPPAQRRDQADGGSAESGRMPYSAVLRRAWVTLETIA